MLLSVHSSRSGNAQFSQVLAQQNGSSPIVCLSYQSVLASANMQEIGTPSAIATIVSEFTRWGDLDVEVGMSDVAEAERSVAV